MKDIILPRLYTTMRDTMFQAGWVASINNPEDTFVVLIDPTDTIRCVLHYMPECKTIYPDGTFTLKLNADEDTWTVETSTRPITEHSASFIEDFTRLQDIAKILKGQLKKVPF